LPHYVWADFLSVLEELDAAGYSLRPEWYEAFLEFRFPVFGRVAYQDISLELRMGLEPWLVLGEETVTHRQARVVDSAVEKLQMTARGLDRDRYLVTCNGRRLPLKSTGLAGEYVAGVRYKAWKSSFGLHPTIEVHAPLVFDLIDRRLGRSVGGCIYHVAHPGGLAYETFPINAYEAESRRISRFWDWGHTQGTAPPPAWAAALRGTSVADANAILRDPPAERANPAYPHTLDLRRLAPS
ncbi:MAG: transglutaminase domain protein, partial [Proteobacteria bacterium]|nr:transglutaminase domain protein [Pseudomonadota bacterium]